MDIAPPRATPPYTTFTALTRPRLTPFARRRQITSSLTNKAGDAEARLRVAGWGVECHSLAADTALAVFERGLARQSEPVDDGFSDRLVYNFELRV